MTKASATDNLHRLLDGLRGVGNLHEFAELFGFDWYDDSDWCWHDVAVKMADDIEHSIVRCRDCKHSRKDGTLCMLFASWVPIAGGDEYAEIPAAIEPDGFCAWGERR